MNLKTVTLFAAVTLLLANLCQITSDIRGLMELASGHVKFEQSWLYFLTMPFYLLAWIALDVFLFTLAVKQKND